MHYKIEIKEIHIENDVFRLIVSARFKICSELSKVKLVLHFNNGLEERLLPLVISNKSSADFGIFNLYSDYKYFLHNLFWKT
ncbi:MAG: hypothetical protein LUE92_06780, partial [Clostridiales bacterium]|nr:hypothetical protein [Clostridiales bacterium]